MKQDVKGRRRLVAGLGAAATAVAMGSRTTAHRRPRPFVPARHPQDEWMGKMTGTHRVILDVTSPEGMPDAIRFVGNLYTGHQTGYNVPGIGSRHHRRAAALGDGLRIQQRVCGRSTGRGSIRRRRHRPRAIRTTPATACNCRRWPGAGVQFMVCGTASRGISRRLAGEKGDADATFKEMEANLIASARIVRGRRRRRDPRSGARLQLSVCRLSEALLLFPVFT